jgi:hypothetical protein
MNTQKETKKINPLKVALQWLLIIAAVFIFFQVKNAILDGDSEPKETATSKIEAPVEKKTTAQNEDKKLPDQPTGIDSFVFSSYAAGLSGSSFMKEATATGDKGVITFYSDYAEYKQANTKSLLTEDDYTLYFSSGAGLEKTLFEATSYLFNKIVEMDKLSVVLPFDGKVYSYDVTREQVKNYIGEDRSDETIRKDFIKDIVNVN